MTYALLLLHLTFVTQQQLPTYVTINGDKYPRIKNLSVYSQPTSEKPKRRRICHLVGWLTCCRTCGWHNWGVIVICLCLSCLWLFLPLFPHTISIGSTFNWVTCPPDCERKQSEIGWTVHCKLNWRRDRDAVIQLYHCQLAANYHLHSHYSVSVFDIHRWTCVHLNSHWLLCGVFQLNDLSFGEWRMKQQQQGRSIKFIPSSWWWIPFLFSRSKLEASHIINTTMQSNTQTPAWPSFN